MKEGDVVSPHEDYIMDNGEVAYVKGKCYTLKAARHPYFNVIDEAGDVHYMEDTDLENHFDVVVDVKPNDTNDNYDRAMGVLS